MTSIATRHKLVVLVAALLCTSEIPVRAQGASASTKPSQVGHPSVPQADGLSFADQPNFVVSGVTDWTAVGGHGSDVTLRTSEDLARSTAHLKPQNPIGSAFDSATERRLLAAARTAQNDLALGEFYLKAGRYQQALAPLQASSDASQSNAEAEYDLALACRGLHDAPQAKLHLARALTQRDASAYHLLAGQLYEDAGDPYQAVQELRRAAQLQPSEENYFAWASELLLHRAVTQAADVFKHGVAGHPSSVRMRTGYSSALFAEAQYEQAALQMCEAVKLGSEAAATYLLLGKVDEVSPEPLPCILPSLTRFLQVQPTNAAAHYLYAMATYRRERDSNREVVTSHLKEAVKLNPNYAEAFLQLGLLSATARAYPEAVSYYQQALSADPMQVEAHYRLALAYDRTGQPELAKQERALYQETKKQQAEIVERDRRSVKQFVVENYSPLSTK